MALLYQEIMNVPGLTGTWKERNAQLYKLLGSPQGAYQGNLQQNLYLLDQLKKNSYFKGGLPGQQTQPAQQTQVKPQTTIADQYSQPGVQAGQSANVPSFQEAMPFYDAWAGMVPQASQAAASQINPELMRQYKGQYSDYMTGLTSSGGERFGRGLQGVGELKASTERNRQAQMQDWLNQYQQGYKTLFYEPSQTAWNQAITQGRTPDQSLRNIPTWDDVYSKYQGVYGTGETASPLYG